VLLPRFATVCASSVYRAPWQCRDGSWLKVEAALVRQAYGGPLEAFAIRERDAVAERVE
jgi:hypothetical protein